MYYIECIDQIFALYTGFKLSLDKNKKIISSCYVQCSRNSACNFLVLSHEITKAYVYLVVHNTGGDRFSLFVSKYFSLGYTCVYKRCLITSSSCNQVPGAELPQFCIVLFVRFVFCCRFDTSKTHYCTKNCTNASEAFVQLMLGFIITAVGLFLPT